VSTIVWEVVENYLRTRVGQILFDMWRSLTVLYRNIGIELLSSITTVPGKPVEARITQEDLNVLLSDAFGPAVIREISASEVRGYVVLFTVDEEEKGRRRLICEPGLNAIFFEVGDFNMAPLVTPFDVFEGIEKTPGATQTDYPWFYGQLPIDEQVQAWYCFPFMGRWYCLCTVPTGARQLPFIAHVITHTICQDAAERHCVQGLPYLDNVAFRGLASAARNAMSAFLNISTSVGIQTGNREDAIMFRTAYPFLGVWCQHGSPSTFITPSAALTYKTYMRIQAL
jgi:hypothetical protein